MRVLCWHPFVTNASSWKVVITVWTWGSVNCQIRSISIKEEVTDHRLAATVGNNKVEVKVEEVIVVLRQADHPGLIQAAVEAKG